MITTVSLNPSVDRRYILPDFEKNKIFRTKEYEATAGGKGLNVTRVISSLGEEVMATGLIGGKSGDFIQDELSRLGIKNDFLSINQETRSCIAILSGNGEQTEILESGPALNENIADSFLDHFRKAIKKSSVIVASGSVPPGLPISIYGNMAELCSQENIPFLLDTSGLALKESIKASPTLIKPNLEELEALVGNRLNMEQEIISAGKKLASQGIRYVVISLGASGSFVISGQKAYRVKLPRVTVKNPVGSGDSMVAGFAIGLLRGYDIVQAIKLASAAGTANAMEEGTGSVKEEIVLSLIEKIEVNEV